MNNYYPKGATRFRPSRRQGAAVTLSALLLIALGGPALVADAQPARPTASAPARTGSVAAERTTQIQYLLRSFGYTIAVDGVYGPQTTRVVKAWQKANGLEADGIAGIKTWDSLNTAATATVPAVRLNPPAPPAEPVGDVESIIRSVWPDDLEDWAVRIATRESRLVPTAANACCYGLFQIHFRAHRAWLGDYGVNQPSDLFDPRTNATVALALYQETGPGPWRL